jgi:hypothetical protein
MVLGADSYEDLIGKFTELKYMVQSKYIRQVILGNLLPAKQMKIEQYLTYQVLQILINPYDVKKENILMFSPDEIVFQSDCSDYLVYSAYDNHIENHIKTNLGLNVDVEIFKLKNIEPFQNFFVKEFVNKSGFELMCVSGIYFPQVYKQYTGQKLEEKDLVFWHENQLAKFIEPLKNMYKTT